MSSLLVSFPLDPAQGKVNDISCSIECYREHQTIHKDELPTYELGRNIHGLPLKPPPAMLVNPPSTKTIAKPLQPESPFETLESSPDLQNMYTLYPKLLAHLREVYVATLGPSPDFQYSENRNSGRFSRFDRGRGRVRGKGRGGSGSDGVSWTPEKGRKLALLRIKKFRGYEGEEGNGMREFSRLVTGLVRATGRI